MLYLNVMHTGTWEWDTIMGYLNVMQTSTWEWETIMGYLIKTHVTFSEQGGVVREPS